MTVPGLVGVNIPKEAFWILGGVIVLGGGGYIAYKAIKKGQINRAETKAGEAGSPESIADVIAKLVLCDYAWGRVQCLYVKDADVLSVAPQLNGMAQKVIEAYRKLTGGRSLLQDVQAGLDDSNYLQFRKLAGI